MTPEQIADAIDPRLLVHNYKREEVAGISVPVDSLIAAADLIRAQSWRPIDDRARNGQQWLLAEIEAGRILWACDDHWSEDVQCWCDATRSPTHYMPLPPAPKGEEG